MVQEAKRLESQESGDFIYRVRGSPGMHTSKEVRLLIRKKHRMWTRYMETRDQNYLNRYNITGTKYEVKQGMYKEWNNALSLHSASRIPKNFGTM